MLVVVIIEFIFRIQRSNKNFRSGVLVLKSRSPLSFSVFSTDGLVQFSIGGRPICQGFLQCKCRDGSSIR